MSLAPGFLANLKEGAGRFAGVRDLEGLLAAALSAGRAAWPALALAPGAFLQHLAAHVGASEAPRDALATVHAADLYLACACGLGVPAATAAFEGKYMRRAAAYFAQNGSLAPHSEELLQLVRMRVLMPDGAAGARIGEYSGRAPLGAWFRIVVARLAINFARTRRPSERTEPADGVASPGPDPEIAYLKSHHREDLEAAFRDTLEALPARTGNILRLFYFEGVSADAIGRSKGVTARTIQRWIARARTKILRDTQRRLAAKLQLSTSQVGGLMNLVQSQIDVSISRFFRE